MRDEFSWPGLGRSWPGTTDAKSQGVPWQSWLLGANPFFSGPGVSSLGPEFCSFSLIPPPRPSLLRAAAGLKRRSASKGIGKSFRVAAWVSTTANHPAPVLLSASATDGRMRVRESVPCTWVYVDTACSNADRFQRAGCRLASATAGSSHWARS